jgi:hypothetical protein
VRVTWRFEAKTPVCTTNGSDDANQFVARQLHPAVAIGQSLSRSDSAGKPIPRGVRHIWGEAIILCYNVQYLQAQYTN